MGILDLPHEVHFTIISLLPGRQDLSRWRSLCKSADHILRGYRKGLNVACVKKHDVGLGSLDSRPSSVECFRDWLRIRYRDDESVLEIGRQLFDDHTEEKDWQEGFDREEHVITRDVREYIGETDLNTYLRVFLDDNGLTENDALWVYELFAPGYVYAIGILCR
jgi:hypothetical protein